MHCSHVHFGMLRTTNPQSKIMCINFFLPPQLGAVCFLCDGEDEIYTSEMDFQFILALLAF